MGILVHSSSLNRFEHGKDVQNHMLLNVNASNLKKKSEHDLLTT